MNKNSKIYVAGHRGLAGSAILRGLEKYGYKNIITKTHIELDLTSEKDTKDFFEKEKPEYIFLAAAKVGGIGVNSSQPADFITQNLQIQTNVITCAHKYKAKKLLFLGSSCIYPKLAPQPMKEEYLLTGDLEPTSKPYAISKITGIIMCQSYTKQYGLETVSVMPANLYGQNDNFNLETSHVMPALIRKFHEAKENNTKEVVVWGTGKPMREFLHVDDLASACIFLMNNYSDPDIINIGTGKDVSIKELTEIVKEIVGYEGDIIWDSSKPDGTPRKVMDVSKINKLGWESSISLREGIKMVYEWYKNNKDLRK